MKIEAIAFFRILAYIGICQKRYVVEGGDSDDIRFGVYKVCISGI